MFFSPPYGRTMIGGGGAQPCTVVVIKCGTGFAVFHFELNDDPRATLGRYTWPAGCEALVCGGDDEAMSDCIANLAIETLERNGNITVIGVSPSSECGYWIGHGWYQNNEQYYGTTRSEVIPPAIGPWPPTGPPIIE